jgi:hypothetical protein
MKRQCPKCLGPMVLKRRVDKPVRNLQPARHECRCGYIIEANGKGHWPDEVGK